MPNEQEMPKFEFKLPIDEESCIASQTHNNIPEFNPNLSKKEFNHYLITNIEPIVRLVYGLISEVENQRIKIEKLESEIEMPNPEKANDKPEVDLSNEMKKGD